MAAKRASKAKGTPKAGSRARRETAAERKERIAREARNQLARERREEKRLEAEREAKREAARKRKEAKKQAQAAADEAARLLTASSKEALRLVRRREADKRRREKKKREQEGLPQERQRVGPPAHVQAPHPFATGESAVVAELVLKSWKSELRDVAREVGGRFRTHLLTDTGEVQGSVWVDAPDDLGDIGAVVGSFGDAYNGVRTGLYYGDTFFQGFATVVVAGGRKSKKKGGSPLNESRTGSDGKHYETAVTYWFWADAQKCIYALGEMIGRVLEGHSEFSLVKFGVRQYWSPLGLRPER